MASTGPKSRKDDLVIQETDGEILIYDLRTNKAFCLNETSAFIWKTCDGSRDISEISKIVSSEFRSDANEDLVWLALDQFKKEGLLTAGSSVETRFAGMSRRDVVRRIGIGAAIALPIIAGIVAPPAYAQSSVCGTTCTCKGSTTAGQVCSTIGGGVACPASPAGCTVCRATTTGGNPSSTSPGNCFTA